MVLHLPGHTTPLDEYNRSMRATLGSKLFFLEAMPVPIRDIAMWVDFGCADAALLKALHRSCPDAWMIGIDNSSAQREAAFKNFPDLDDCLSCFADFRQTYGDRPHYPGPRALILSSVLHEVLSIGSASRDFASWWRGAEDMGFDYVIIRDFAIPSWCREARTPSAWLEKAAFDAGYLGLMQSFCERWGSTRRLDNFMHFLLKSPYEENWERELEENYIALDHRQLLNTVTFSGSYHVHHREHTSTKFHRGHAKAMLGCVPDIPTHAEVLLERNPTALERHHDMEQHRLGWPMHNHLEVNRTFEPIGDREVTQ